MNLPLHTIRKAFVTIFVFTSLFIITNLLRNLIIERSFELKTKKIDGISLLAPQNTEFVKININIEDSILSQVFSYCYLFYLHDENNEIKIACYNYKFNNSEITKNLKSVHDLKKAIQNINDNFANRLKLKKINGTFLTINNKYLYEAHYLNYPLDTIRILTTGAFSWPYQKIILCLSPKTNCEIQTKIIKSVAIKFD